MGPAILAACLIRKVTTKLRAAGKKYSLLLPLLYAAAKALLSLEPDWWLHYWQQQPFAHLMREHQLRLHF